MNHGKGKCHTEDTDAAHPSVRSGEHLQRGRGIPGREDGQELLMEHNLSMSDVGTGEEPTAVSVTTPIGCTKSPSCLTTQRNLPFSYEII